MILATKKERERGKQNRTKFF